ncbi:MAG TPA: S9 family peptidase [Acidimicrobiales bacterium]|jgi:oligopeptidase B|nr:S9 family peptidase [Acidimicrobiales bacterium]
MSGAPVAPRKPHIRRVHGEETPDEFYWLLDRDDPDTIAYLEAENAYTETQTEHLAPLRDRLFEEIKARVQETDLSVPTRRGPWWYVTRTEEGKQYSTFCRRPEPDDETAEVLLLDGNELAGDSPFFALGVVDISPDHSLLAYSTDYDGNESFALRFRDLATGEDLSDVIESTYYGSAWAADNATFFYTTIDDAHRPHRLWKHRLGTAKTDDVLVYEETDERFFLGVELTRSERFIVVQLDSKITSEVRVLDATRPDGPLRVVEPRRQGVEYSIDHQDDRFLIVHNDGALNFELAAAPVDAPGRDHWQPLLAHRDDTRLMGVDSFAGHVVVHFRRDALPGVRVLRNDGDDHEIVFDEPLYDVAPGANPEFDTTVLRLGYESFVTPPTVYDYELDRRVLTLMKQQPVLGGYDPTDYVQAREWATAADGTRVPISVVHRAGVARDGSAPALLYGYGSYETSLDPWFSAIRLPMLDRGIVWAVAHVRGGGELGRQWYEDGKLVHKRTTFTDFVACAEHLCATRYTSPERLAARGGSAGGLLMGAVANLAPQQFAAILAEVPFVDALNTILDPTLPLTVIEWEEWGNPVESAEVFRYMRSYSPYENVEAKDYPAILATAGLNDPRVGYHEPAKWVAKLRTTKTDGRPILLKTEMGAGHGGPSGRYDVWRDQAFVMAFVIEAIGAPETPL